MESERISPRVKKMMRENYPKLACKQCFPEGSRLRDPNLRGIEVTEVE